MISAEDREFNRLRKAYYARFNAAYGIVPGDGRSLAEHIQIMRDAIETGVMPPEEKEGII